MPGPSAKHSCTVTEPSTQIDACVCNATERGKCDQPDSTCRHRAVIAGSGPVTVQKAHAYDTHMREAAAKTEKLAKCSVRTQRTRCAHKAPSVPVTADPDARDTSQTPTGDGPRGDCEIAQQRFGFNILGQPTSRLPWQPPDDYAGPPNNNDRSYNVIGQRVLRAPTPAKALPLSQLGADSKANRCKSRYNVIGQRLLDPRHICIRKQYVDMRPYNVIGQPVFPPVPPPPPKQKPVDPLCVCTPMAF